MSDSLNFGPHLPVLHGDTISAESQEEAGEHPEAEWEGLEGIKSKLHEKLGLLGQMLVEPFYNFIQSEKCITSMHYI